MSCRILFFLGLFTLLCAGCATPRTAPFAAPPATIVLDGQASPAEWRIPEAVPEAGDVHLRVDEDFLYLAVRSNKVRPVHLYLGRPDEVHVLHASGSLGRAVYRRAVTGDWELTQSFVWQVRDPRFGRQAGAPEVERERSDYLHSQGWAANTIGMGVAGQVEFKVARQYLEQAATQLAVSYFWEAADGTEQIRHWPGEAEITPAERPLLMGESVPADFRLQGWLPVSPSSSPA